MNKTQHPLYGTWAHLKQVCYNPNNKGYSTHGARGIAMDPGWRADFDVFAQNMGPRPHNYTLQRHDTDGPYGPDNCFWGKSGAQPRTHRWKQRVTDAQVSEIRWMLDRQARHSSLAAFYHVSTSTLYLIDKAHYRPHCPPVRPPQPVIDLFVPAIWR